MELDERVIKYMKVRNEFAKTVANLATAQLFSIASFYCMYALYSGGVFSSGSLTFAKITILSVMCIISVVLCVINALTVKRSKKVNIMLPDSIAVRSAQEVVREAYIIARPVLIQKITGALLVLPATGLVYIILIIFMDNRSLCDNYGKIMLFLGLAAIVSIAAPCVDRINCYRLLLNEIHISYMRDTDNKKRMIFGYVIAGAVPLSILIWSLLRFYSTSQSIAWITFPITFLVAAAAFFLVGWCFDNPYVCEEN